MFSRTFGILLWFVLPVALVGFLDLTTGPEYGLSILYLVPVVLAGWLQGPKVAGAIALEAAGLWLWAESITRPDAPLLAIAWNGFTRLAIYVAMGLGAGVLRADREQFRELARREQELARTDLVTGLSNRRAFDEQLQADLARSRRDQRPLSVLMLDLDNFKRVNDAEGHAVGDRALAEVAVALRGVLREGDRVARVGGDEFAAILWGVDARGARSVAERAVRAVRKIAERYPSTELGASAGVAEDQGGEASALVAAADQALYRAKEGGKGMVEGP